MDEWLGAEIFSCRDAWSEIVKKSGEKGRSGRGVNSFADDLAVFVSSWEGSAAIFIGVLMAFFLPSDVLSQCKFLSIFVDWMGGIFPLINGYGEKSDFPEVTRTYFSVMLLMSPVLIRHIIMERGLYMVKRVKLRKSNPIKFVVSGIYVGSVFLVFVIYWLFWHVGSVSVFTPEVGGRLSLAFFGFGYAGFFVWIMIAAPVIDVIIFFENRPLVIRG